MEDWRAGGFGIYVHWPFCQSKCPYCDFNSHVAQEIDPDLWLRSYLSEIDRFAEMLPGRVVQSVYFGGGTPSLMDPRLVEAILNRIGERWTPSNDIEITLEANPGSVEAGRFRDFREAGVNRVSMGIQALNDLDLKRLGRMHTRGEALAALRIAQKTFSRVNFDLIYARQDQTLEQWRSELGEALTYAADHLSLYQLTIEAGTVFAKRAAKGLLAGLPGEELAADMYDVTQDMCSAAGLPAYEVSNHAAPGNESRHNHVYWRYGDYVGIGPGAHGRITVEQRRLATEAHREPGKWLDAVARKGTGDVHQSDLPGHEQALEYLLMSLRISEGTDTERFTRLNGSPLSEQVVLDLIQIDLLERRGAFLRTTAGGRLVLNSVLRALSKDL